MIKFTHTDNLEKVLLLVATITIILISTLMGINGYDKLCFLFSLIGYIIMFIGVIKFLRNYSNITVVYMAFMLLYTYSGVYSVLWGEGIHRIFTPQYNTSIFLILSNIAYCSILVGFLLTKSKNNVCIDCNFREYFAKYARKFLNRAIIVAFIAFFMELINFLRVGGKSALVLGKAYYNSKVSDLILTLPGELLTTISFIYFSLFLCYTSFNIKELNIRKALLFIIPISMVLTLYTILGRRGLLLTFAIILFIGFTYYRPIRKIPLKLIIGVIILYVILSVLYSVRAYIGYYLFEQKDVQGLINLIFNKERFMRSLMPSQNEFGVAFGNFNEYYISSAKDIKFGETYLRGLLLLIPGWIYPGEKPLQILYEFRNIYFPIEASRGSIASTGFSFLLEAYMNFKVFGVAWAYFIVGLLLGKLESNRIKRWNSPLYTAFYLSCFSVVPTFQRNAFGDIFGTLIMYIIIILLTSYKSIIKTDLV